MFLAPRCILMMFVDAWLVVAASSGRACRCEDLLFSPGRIVSVSRSLTTAIRWHKGRGCAEAWKRDLVRLEPVSWLLRLLRLELDEAHEINHVTGSADCRFRRSRSRQVRARAGYLTYLFNDVG